MIVTAKHLSQYRDTLASINRKAAEEIQQYMLDHNYQIDEAFLEFADAIVVKYGEAAGALSAQFYDDVAEYWQNKNAGSAAGSKSARVIPPAEPAALPTEDEIARTVYGTMKESAEKIPDAVSRLVKKTAENTTLQNAIRDQAQYAWIPHGDTCPYCIWLASLGWMWAGEDTINGKTAGHVHANCDCTYAVRFDEDTEYAGYNPKTYKKIISAAEGDTDDEKINSLRRAAHAADPEKDNARKREQYADDHEFTSVLEKYRKNATPGTGNFKIDDSRKIKNRELENMELLYNEFGGDIRMLAESYIPNERNADYLWRGKLWEEQEPNSHRVNAIDQNTREAIQQIAKKPGGIVLDVGDSTMPLAEIKNAVLKRLRRSSRFNCDIVIIRDGSVEDIMHYRKK